MNTLEQARTMTPWQMQMLSEIFRIILKEITCDEDKEKLAPGELGVSYLEGCLYVRDPHTGELFSPNSTAHINQILSKFDPVTNLLNADRVSHIRFYSNISQLSQLGISLSADTIIRQMEYPAILMSPVNYSNYKTLGFPSDSGMMLVFKVSPETVIASFYDDRTYTTYDGRYNKFTQFFEGWSTSGGAAETEYVETSGGGNQTSITVKQDIKDLMIISVRVTETLNPGAMISVNGGEYAPIINADGTPLATSVASNNIIMLIYDQARNGWILVTSTQSSVMSVVTMLSSRLTSLTDTVAHMQKDFTEKLRELKTYVDKRLTEPGKIVTATSTFTASLDAVDTINAVENYVHGIDKLIINYNQTILREGIDYVIEAGGSIQLKEFSLKSGDVLQFIVIKQTAAAQ